MRVSFPPAFRKRWLAMPIPSSMIAIMTGLSLGMGPSGVDFARLRSAAGTGPEHPLNSERSLQPCPQPQAPHR